MVLTWNEECGPADNNKVVLPANGLEAHWGRLEQNKSGYLLLARIRVVRH